ncbi:tRNA (adenosine(37)-N6)-dimethylallyltransferase MiaA [Candidatus Nomurabacteria bacterium RIFCSPLOWO2_02_FULL_40_10]|uniref:tRNA dimethylallyltransferase n=1 Tax=Candidatus Nomurabacteria bacterium RIFCSPLOWO2_02_FULL_40_10 TaxID=1801786 RepID=A0A1F6XW00_9BACT|nr:MAG: tRNA (adenosine(37)-N6)-dimethylallyltransferase MiaA [Candidatus Nomurabacteria bacterium RIFCSPLOWO2_02_FULL_40_10]
MKRIKVIIIVGPTSSGKSDLAVLVAKRFRGEVVSADSRQVYKGMDIGTGKITKKEMKGIPHHLLDVVSPKETFTVAKFKKLAEKTIKEINAKNKLPIICGGTGLYVDAFLYDWDIPKVSPKPEIRKSIQYKTTEELFKMLSGLDPARAATIDKNNKVRLVRALEIVLATGAPVPSFKPFEKKNSPYEFIKIGIRTSNEELKSRIHTRLLKRLKQGMVSEVEKLHRQGVSWKRLDSFGLEYRWVSRYLRGLINEEEMIKTLEKEIWHYAKRQMTWFKRDKNTIWLNSPQKASREVQDFLGREVLP